MANDANIRMGFFPVTAPQCPPPTLPFRVETSATLQYFRGQLVQINSNGRVQPVAAGATQSIGALGVAWNFLDLNLAGPPSGMNLLTQGAFLPANTDAFVEVTYDPLQLYVIEEVTGGTAINTNSIGLGVDFTYAATTGNTNTGFCNAMIANNVVTAGTLSLLQLVNVHNILNADATVNAPGASCKWIVRIQRHTFGNAILPLPQTL